MMAKARMGIGLFFLMIIAWSMAYASDDMKYKLGVDVFTAKGGGAKIARVIPHYPAAEIGLEPGMVILAVNGKLIQTAAEGKNIVWSSGDKVNLIYMDMNNNFYQIECELVSGNYKKGGKTYSNLIPKGGKPTPRRVHDPRKKN